MSLKILVTACGGDLGQAVIKSLRLSSETYEIVGCDSDPQGVGPAFVEKFYPLPKAADPQYFQKLNTLCRSEKISAVIPACDAEINILAGHRLESGAVVVSQDASWIHAYGDKLRCMQTLAGSVPLAPFADGKNAAALEKLTKDTGFPLVVKPRASFGSRLILKVLNENELKGALVRVQDPLVQQYLDDKEGEFSVGIYGEPKGPRIIAFKRALNHGGASWYAETSSDKSVLDYCLKIARASQVQGSVNIQLRKTEAGPRLLEINARFSSLAAARAICGFNDVDWSVRAAMGLELEPAPTEYKKIRFRRFFHELVDLGKGFVAVDDWSPRPGAATGSVS